MNLIGKGSSMLGESDANIQRAVNGIVPSVFAGVLNKAGSGISRAFSILAKDAMALVYSQSRWITERRCLLIKALIC